MLTGLSHRKSQSMILELSSLSSHLSSNIAALPTTASLPPASPCHSAPAVAKQKPVCQVVARIERFAHNQSIKQSICFTVFGTQQGGPTDNVNNKSIQKRQIN